MCVHFEFVDGCQNRTCCKASEVRSVLLENYWRLKPNLDHGRTHQHYLPSMYSVIIRSCFSMLEVDQSSNTTIAGNQGVALERPAINHYNQSLGNQE